MTVVKRILSGLVVFIGGIGMWYLTMKAIQDKPSPRKASRRPTSYYSYAKYCQDNEF